MSRSALGKRGRVSPSTDQTPRKRTRRQAKEPEGPRGSTLDAPRTPSKKTGRQQNRPETPRGLVIELPKTPCTRRRCPTKESQSPWDNNEENHDPCQAIADSDDDEANAGEDGDEDDMVGELPYRTRKLHVQSLAVDSVVDRVLTPSTPRHRDTVSDYPSTPRRTVMSAGKLFRRMTPHTPHTRNKASAVQTIYHSARQLFDRNGREAGLDQLVGREHEAKQLRAFLGRCSSSSPHGCIYVSGAPGTGKSAMVTAMVQELMRHNSHDANIRSAYINCMSINSPKALYDTLLSTLGLGGHSSDEDAKETLQQAFCPSPTESSTTRTKSSAARTKSSTARTKSSTTQTMSPTVYQVTLDEIDHMLKLDLESLYSVMEWSMQKSSRLVLIGIANALDLTDRSLPRLKEKNLKPELLPFLPYTTVQVRKIIETRLKSLLPADRQDFVPLIHPAAIELCARKVSSKTGDVRQAFEICRRALELVEADTRFEHENEAREKLLQQTPCKQALSDKVNEAAGDGSCRSVLQTMTLSLGALTAETAPRASARHMNKITVAAFGNGATQRLKTLNLQQRAALCALVTLEKRARASGRATDVPVTPSKTQTLAPTVKMLFVKYRALCKRGDCPLNHLESTDFGEVVSSLETLGLVNTVDGRGGSFGDERRIASSLSEKEVEAVAEGRGAGILRSILAGDSMS